MNKTLLATALVCALVGTSTTEAAYKWVPKYKAGAVCVPTASTTFACDLGDDKSGTIEREWLCADETTGEPGVETDCTEANPPVVKPTEPPADAECGLTCAGANQECNTDNTCKCVDGFEFDQDEVCQELTYKWFVKDAPDAQCTKKTDFTLECGPAGASIQQVASCYWVDADGKEIEKAADEDCDAATKPAADAKDCALECADETKTCSEAGKCVTVTYAYKAVDVDGNCKPTETEECDVEGAQSGKKDQKWACFKSIDGAEQATAEATLAECVAADGEKTEDPPAVDCSLPACAAENTECKANKCECKEKFVKVDDKCVNSSMTLSVVGAAAVAAIAAVFAF